MTKPAALCKGPATLTLASCAALIVIAGCGGDGGDADQWQQQQREQTQSSPAPTQAPSTPALTEGKTVPVMTSDSELLDIPGGAADVTLIDVAAARTGTDPDTKSTATADPDEQFICLELKIKNTGNTDFDTYPFTHGKWLGDDGEVKSIGFTVGIECEDLGQHGDDLVNAPDLKPGQFVHGTTVLSVPSTQPGRLEFSDREDIPLAYVRTQPVR